MFFSDARRRPRPKGAAPIVFYGNGQANFEHQDWQGTERVRTTYNGQTQGAFTSLPFGDGYSATGSDWDPYHFAGLDRDNSSATNHATFRQYGEAAGSWMSPDPYSGSCDFSNPQTLNRYAYVLNNPLSFTDRRGLECVWDDGSYDSADDPGTGTADACTDQGGTWVDPLIFEGAMNTQRGDWSPNPSAGIQEAWLTPKSVTYAGSGTIMSSNFKFDMSAGQFISMMQQAGFSFSALDTALGKTGFGHPGVNMRQNAPECSYHLNITPGTGANGVPVSGTFHLDLVNPLYPIAGSGVPLSQMPLHGLLDVIPDITGASWTGQYECDEN